METTSDDRADPRVAYVNELLEDHEPIDAREEKSLEEIRIHMATKPQPFSREADPAHITVSGLIVSERGVILHLHKKIKRWIQIGGHIDGDEFPYDAAVREAWEEAGLATRHPDNVPTFFHIDVHPANGHTHLDMRYALWAEPHDPKPMADESPDVEWFSWEKAEAMADEAMAGMFRAYRRKFNSQSS